MLRQLSDQLPTLFGRTITLPDLSSGEIPDNLRARVRRIITRLDAAAVLRRLVAAAKNRRVALYADDDGKHDGQHDHDRQLAIACSAGEPVSSATNVCASRLRVRL